MKLKTQPRAPSHLPEEEALDDHTIASLPAEMLEQMTCQELWRIVSASGHPWQSDLEDEELSNYDCPTLRRLVYLARRCCQQRLVRQELQDQEDDSRLSVVSTGTTLCYPLIEENDK